MEDDLKKIRNGRQPQRKRKMEDDLKKKERKKKEDDLENQPNST
jgi:hypothetical protein